MPREIIHVSVGQCGNQIGHVFWNRMLKEHNLGQDGYFKFHDKLQYDDFFKLDKIDVYFRESGMPDKYVPRSILVDLEPGVLDALKSRDIGGLFKPDNFIFGVSGGANNWAKTHYQEGPEMIDEIVDVIRRSMESCDCPQGLQLTQSLGGGTGSGLGSLILLKIRENYPDRIVSTFSVFPSDKVSDVVVEPYNATLTMPMLLQDADQVNVIDNEA
eukprot:460223_1